MLLVVLKPDECLEMGKDKIKVLFGSSDKMQNELERQILEAGRTKNSYLNQSTETLKSCGYGQTDH